MGETWNRFLDFERREGDFDPPKRLFARLDRIDRVEKKYEGGFETWRVLLDAVDAEWFAGNWRGLLAEDGPGFDDVPLYAVEIDLPPLPGWMVCFLEWMGSWLEVRLGAPGFGEVNVYANLFQEEPRKRPLASVRLAGPTVARQLSRAFGFQGIPNATEAELFGALAAVGSVDHAAVWDVGQGSCGSAMDPSGRPSLYLDFGCGVYQNTRTFPSSLKTLCLPTGVPVVLSHWDADHWSLTHRLKAQTAVAISRPWIAPRQRGLGPSHRIFAQGLRRHGTLLLWSGWRTTLRTGDVLIEKCTGKSRNESGLSVTVLVVGSPAKAILFPGDARYAVVPSAAAGTYTYSALVVPHHGGATRGVVPGCAGRPQDRALYSFGPGNWYGHPAKVTQRSHDAHGWRHPGMSAPPDLVRETANRGSAGLGHVGICLKAGSVLPLSPACHSSTCSGAGGKCDLAIQQV